MDGRSAWRDNGFVERLWKSIKYEEVFLHAYDPVFAAKSGIAKYLDFYNQERPHSSLGKQTPDEAYAPALWRRVDDATNALSKSCAFAATA